MTDYLNSAMSADNARCSDSLTITHPLLIVDLDLWYEWDRDLTALRQRVEEAFGFYYRSILTAADVTQLFRRHLASEIVDGDVILLPLMAGALLHSEIASLVADTGGVLVPLPSSRHPNVSLPWDGRETLFETMSAYQEYVHHYDASWETLAGYGASLNRPLRVVFVDILSATGKDAQLAYRMWQRAVPDGQLEFRFLTLVLEVSDDPQCSPGWRAGKRVRWPDGWAIQLVNHNTKLLSHLITLLQPQEERVVTTKDLLARYPHLLQMWDSLPDGLKEIHGYHRSEQEIHRNRTHLRFSKAEVESDLPRRLLDHLSSYRDLTNPTVEPIAPAIRAQRYFSIVGLG